MKKLFLSVLFMMVLTTNANALSPVVTGAWIERAIKLCKPHGGIHTLMFIDNLVFKSDVLLTCLDGKQFKAKG